MYLFDTEARGFNLLFDKKSIFFGDAKMRYSDMIHTIFHFCVA
jgi:hypothetical protein